VTRKGDDVQDIPILTDVVELRAASRRTGSPARLVRAELEAGALLSAGELEALQADLVGRALNLTDELLHSATREMEGVLFERVLDRLRAALPEIVSAALREHLSPPDD
jgi:hypothetical protein